MGSMSPSNRSARAYARKSEISRTVQAARANGIPVNAIECLPDGTIRLSSATEPGDRAKTAFDLWDEAGKL